MVPNLVLSLGSNPQSLSLSTKPQSPWWAHQTFFSWEVLFSTNLCGEFSLFSPLSTCCYVPIWGSKTLSDSACEAVSECAKTSPPSWPPLRGTGPGPQIFCIFFILIFCPILFWGDWLTFSDVWFLLPGFRMYSVVVVPYAETFFMLTPWKKSYDQPR